MHRSALMSCGFGLALAFAIVGTGCGARSAIDGRSVHEGSRRGSIGVRQTTSREQGPFSIARRLALVVGNGAYEHIEPLDNPAGDARAVAASLEALGFQVKLVVDVGRDRFEREVETFRDGLQDWDLAVLYYAGHGAEVRRRNLLLPIDFSASQPEDAPAASVMLEWVVARLARNRQGLNLVILDACRNNPFSWAGEPGLYQPELYELGQTTVLWSSTQPGDLAADGPRAEHSPFTAALLERLNHPGDLLMSDVSVVHQGVLARTDGRQQTYVVNSVPVAFGLAGRVANADALATENRGVAASRGLLVAVSEVRLRGEARGMMTEGDLVQMLQAQEALGFRDRRVVRGDDASGRGIRRAMDQLLRETRPGDRVALHLSGMGAQVPGERDADDPDGVHEVFLPQGDATLPEELGDALTDDELERFLVDLRRASGPAGSVMVTQAAIGGLVDRLALRDDDHLAPCVAFEPRGSAIENSDGSFLTQAFSEATSVRNLETATFRSLGERCDETMRALGSDGLVVSGAADRRVRDGAWVAHSGYLEARQEWSYLERTVYLVGGRLAGLFPGASVALHPVQAAFPPRSSAEATGEVVETGLGWARVELLDRSAAEVSGRVATVTRRAMPPVGVRVDLSELPPEVRQLVEPLVRPLVLGYGDRNLDVAITWEPFYLHLVDRQTGAELESPIAQTATNLQERLQTAIFRAAQHVYLAGLAAEPDQTASLALFSVDSTEVSSARCGTVDPALAGRRAYDVGMFVPAPSAGLETMWLLRGAAGRRVAFVSPLADGIGIHARGLMLRGCPVASSRARIDLGTEPEVEVAALAIADSSQAQVIRRMLDPRLPPTLVSARSPEHPPRSAPNESAVRGQARAILAARAIATFQAAP